MFSYVFIFSEGEGERNPGIALLEARGVERAKSHLLVSVSCRVVSSRRRPQLAVVASDFASGFAVLFSYSLSFVLLFL